MLGILPEHEQYANALNSFAAWAQATGLRLLRLAHGSAVRFGGLLRLVADQTLKSCAPDEGKETVLRTRVCACANARQRACVTLKSCGVRACIGACVRVCLW